MPAAWSNKDERQYKHILKSCKRTDRRRSTQTCKRIAAATVNRQRSAEGRTLEGLQENLATPGGQVALFGIGWAIGYWMRGQ